MTHVLVPGSFDPPTLGHLDIIERATRLFEAVTVAVVVNPSKEGMFTLSERKDLLREMVQNLPGVRIDTFDGLLVDYCTGHGVSAVVKGVRSAADTDYETPMAQMNFHLAGVDTVLLPSAPQYSFISSSLVKEVARLGGDVSELLTEPVFHAVSAKLGGQ